MLHWYTLYTELQIHSKPIFHVGHPHSMMETWQSSSCTATSNRSCRRRRRTAYTLAQHWRYAYQGFQRDLWTNARGLLGCRPHSPEACWVREGVSHPPPGTKCRCVCIAVLRLCLSFNVSLSLSHPQSELFLTLEPSRALFRIVSWGSTSCNPNHGEWRDCVGECNRSGRWWRVDGRTPGTHAAVLYFINSSIQFTAGCSFSPT